MRTIADPTFGSLTKQAFIQTETFMYDWEKTLFFFLKQLIFSLDTNTKKWQIYHQHVNDKTFFSNF